MTWLKANKKPNVIQTDKDFFIENVKWLLQNGNFQDLMKAELYREIGDMETAQQYVDKSETDKPFLQSIKNKIQLRISTNDSIVFKIKWFWRSAW